MIMMQQKRKFAFYTPISMMKGLTSELTEQLRAHGVKYTHHLLERGQTQQQREELAQQSGISSATITDLVSRADLMRLPGVGSDLSLLLKRAGITSCRNLQQQNAERLYKRLGELHIGQKIAYHAPALPQVRSWIHEAALLAETSPEE